MIPVVIANDARQSSAAQDSGLLRRLAPRNDSLLTIVLPILD
jgi:hypothetical protein